MYLSPTSKLGYLSFKHVIGGPGCHDFSINIEVNGEKIAFQKRLFHKVTQIRIFLKAQEKDVR